MDACNPEPVLNHKKKMRRSEKPQCEAWELQLEKRLSVAKNKYIRKIILKSSGYFLSSY